MNAKKLVIMAMALIVLALQGASQAANVVGYNVINVPANSDVLCTVPFSQTSLGEFVVSSKTSNTITVAATLPTLTANTSYIRMIKGSGEGLWTTVSSATATVLTLADTAIVAQVSVGDKFRVYPHQTIRSVFPLNMLGKSFLGTSGSATKILLYNNNLSAMVQNQSAAQTATCNTSGNFVGSGVNNNTVLKPETQFIIRNQSASATLQFVTLGNAADFSVSMLIAANGDLNIGSGYPFPVLLKGSTGYAIGLNGTLRKVLLFDNSTTGQNKSATKTATSSGAANWVGSGIDATTALKPSEAFVLRMSSTDVGTRVTIKSPY